MQFVGDASDHKGQFVGIAYVGRATLRKGIRIRSHNKEAARSMQLVFLAIGVSPNVVRAD